MRGIKLAVWTISTSMKPVDDFVAKAIQQARNDQRTNSELIGQALDANHRRRAHNAVRILHLRGTREIFNAAVRLCRRKRSRARCVGVDILGQLGTPRMLFRREQAGFLLKMLGAEKNPDVLYCIGVALGHLKDKRAIPALVRFANHRNAKVRYGVVFGLLGYEDTAAIQALIALSSDKDKDVRNWATFGLGDMIARDTREIREALFCRVTDRCLDVRNEAILGLAKRKDATVIELILRDLRASSTRVYTLNAAKEFGHPIFFPALMKHWSYCRNHRRETNSYWESNLRDAMETCKPRMRRRPRGEESAKSTPHPNPLPQGARGFLKG